MYACKGAKAPLQVSFCAAKELLLRGKALALPRRGRQSLPQDYGYNGPWPVITNTFFSPDLPKGEGEKKDVLVKYGAYGPLLRTC